MPRFKSAPYGGEGWRPRKAGPEPWASCGINSEWQSLRRVILHRPGQELEVTDFQRALFLDRIEPDKARRQHDQLTETFERLGIQVIRYSGSEALPNLMFQADLLFMTPEGAVLARPASAARTGEEVVMARSLAQLGIPILRSISGAATFEGADAAWLNPKTVLIGRGLRTNEAGARQVASVLTDLGVDSIISDLPEGTMHLMGQLRFLDRSIALVWGRRIGQRIEDILREQAYEVLDVPDEDEARAGMALNFVTVGPREVVLPAGNPKTMQLLVELGVQCHAVEMSEIAKAAGAMGCLTGVLERDLA